MAVPCQTKGSHDSLFLTVASSRCLGKHERAGQALTEMTLKLHIAGGASLCLKALTSFFFCMFA